MPCGKKPLVKKWDKPKKIRVIKPSRYEQNEESVKVHWRKVMADLELYYKDDKFWESQSETVKDLVGPVIFSRIAEIFDLPVKTAVYEPMSEGVSLVPSEEYYKRRVKDAEVGFPQTRSPFEYSMTDFAPSVSSKEESESAEEEQSEQSEQWSMSSEAATLAAKKSSHYSKSSLIKPSQAWTSSKSFAKFSRTPLKSTSENIGKSISVSDTIDETAHSLDDLDVYPSKRNLNMSRNKNPHYKMLYCNKSETDMIKWNSKYKTKVFEVSASDEFSKKAEIIAKQISKDFYDWWASLGTGVEYKTEIKRPEDIEDLFQVWFDELATRGLVLHPKILPCVLPSVAKAVGVPKAACPSVLKRQIAFDVLGETTPAHTMAFGTSLPDKLKHVPPKNDTEKLWHSVKIPEDLRTMACVWEDVNHLTSTKAFQKWLEQRPHLPMPECLRAAGPGDKKQLYVVPSDYVIKDLSASAQELALPVSQFSLELKEVLSKLMNQ